MPSPATSQLPQELEIWQADFALICPEGDAPWLAWVTWPDSDLILTHDLTEQKPGSDWLWSTVLKAMHHPAVGEPRRPARLHVRRHQLWQPLAYVFKEIGVALVERDQLIPVDGVPEMLDEFYQERCHD
jgi:hypothetical protein